MTEIRQITVTHLGIANWKATWMNMHGYKFYGFGLTRWSAIRALHRAIKENQAQGEKVTVNW